MSKGSNRRPGEGYGNGWDRVFGKKEALPIAQPYGTIRSLIVGTCQNCKHWAKEYGFAHGDGGFTNGCASDGLHQHLSEGAEFWPPADFGCSLWEKNV